MGLIIRRMTHMLRLTRTLPAIAALAAIAGFSNAQGVPPRPPVNAPAMAAPGYPGTNMMAAPNMRPMPNPGMNAPAPAPAGSPVANGVIPEPMAMGAGQYGMGSGYDMYQPNLPNYAWPTYAPYNNYSRVAYPEYYPYDAFPFIGPTHPFPKVPTGWRSVKLEWNDGFWYFSKLGTKHDYWRLRFW
jgi:hypothetical protein